MTYRPRLWHMIVAIIVVSVLSVLMAGLLRQRQGLNRLQHIIADRQAAGQIGSIADLIATLPATDADLQAAWLSWSEGYSKSWVDPKYDEKAYQAWVTGTGPFPQGIADTLAARESKVQPARVMLQREELLLSGAGWLRTHVTNPKYTLMEAAALPLPNLLVQRDLAQWLRHAAVLADDPCPYLRDLDAVIHASRHPVTLIDALILVALLHIRDQAYVETAMRGTLPADMARAWIRDVVPILRLTGQAMLDEGILFSIGTANSIKPGNEWSFGRDVFGESSVRITWDVWWNGTTDSAKMLAYHADVHDRIMGITHTPLPDIAVVLASCGRIPRVLLPNSNETVVTALTSDADQRAIRLAVLLLQAHATTDLPADVAALRTQNEYLDLMEPAGDAFHLTYERLAPRRLRICISPTSPEPNIAIPGRLADLSKIWGTPAARAPLICVRNATIELEVPGKTAGTTP